MSGSAGPVPLQPGAVVGAIILLVIYGMVTSRKH